MWHPREGVGGSSFIEEGKAGPLPWLCGKKVGPLGLSGLEKQQFQTLINDSVGNKWRPSNTRPTLSYYSPGQGILYVANPSWILSKEENELGIRQLNYNTLTCSCVALGPFCVHTHIIFKAAYGNDNFQRNLEETSVKWKQGYKKTKWLWKKYNKI